MDPEAVRDLYHANDFMAEQFREPCANVEIALYPEVTPGGGRRPALVATERRS